LKFNGTNQLLVYWEENINTIKTNKEAPLQASWKVGLERNTVKVKYMVVSHHQNAGQNYNLMMANKVVFENVADSSTWKQK
jgi:hypothetical protein